ncbi:MAG: FtsQ-type POTRA domain-containing protein [Clostridia bacterium]|nr:FtsQ-type POTRA domain-containing protein [Clostridia bacterium]
MRHKKRKKAARQAMSMTVAVVAALALLIVLACSRVFVIRDVMVVGNRNLLREEVVTQSGVRVGDNVLGVTTQQLKKNLEMNRYIEYIGHEFDYRGTLTLRISERLGMAVAYDLGYYYVLDTQGMVLECTGSAYPAGVAGPKVSGFAIEPNSRIAIGEMLPVHDRGQLEAMAYVLAELDSTNLLSRISELNIKNTENVYMLTADGAKIVLGDMTSVRTKLLIAREVLALREEEDNLTGAKIDVSNGYNAHYIPSVLPTVTPVPTATPTIAPAATPGA